MLRIVLRIYLRQPVGHYRKVRFRLLHGNARLQMSEQEPKLRERPGHSGGCYGPVRLLGYPQVGVAPSKSRGHDSNQRSRYSIQHKRLVHNARIGPEVFHPSLIAQHEHWRSSLLVVRRLHHPPQQRGHPQKLKGPRRHVVPVEPQRPFSRTIQHVRVVVGNHPVKNMILLYIIYKFRPAEPRSPAGLGPLRVVDLYGHESLCIRIGKRLHQDIVNHAENRRGSTNSEGQCNDRHHRKSRRLPKVPQRVADILPQRSHSCPPARGPYAPLLHGGSLDPFMVRLQVMYAFFRSLVRRCPSQ